MSTTKIAATLFQLQQIDLELERLAIESQNLENSLKNNPTLQRLRNTCDDAQQQLKAGLQTQKEAEWALEEVSRKLATTEQRLYSGIVVGPKELASLQQEVQYLRAQQNRQEDRTLEVIENTEHLQEQVHLKAEALQQAEAAWAKENTVRLERRPLLQVRQQEQLALRTQLAQQIDEGILTRYTQMRRTKQGQAVSKIEQNSCQWCRVTLTPGELQRARLDSALQTCSNCGRILYFER
ncbi:MAG TPA: hypothetical protein VFN23_03020 [Ktedonobacteraceae bacterium]|nr:hypothetical protein [Ktedonobacteraceae bacterium]